MAIIVLVPLDLASGVTRILLTHPHYPAVELSAPQLVVLSADPRVFIEHCFAIHTTQEVPFARFAGSILATGTAQVVLATDFGQLHSDPIPDGTLRFTRDLNALHGDPVALDDFVAMFSTNGVRALGLATSCDCETMQ